VFAADDAGRNVVVLSQFERYIHIPGYPPPPPPNPGHRPYTETDILHYERNGTAVYYGREVGLVRMLVERGDLGLLVTPEWIMNCVTAGVLLGPGLNWGGLKVECVTYSRSQSENRAHLMT
jgi:hypothetical protein